MSDAIWASAATALVRRLHNGDLSARECLEAFLMRIEQINPQVNAIVTLDEPAAIARAAELDSFDGERSSLPLFGLPIAVKDLVQTKGLRTTFGSPIYADFVPEIDELFVQRLRSAGAIIIGKTNTPEFGAGSQTFNPVFGATRNPYALDRTCGGSSGGAAVSLACEMLPLADGSDLGGSLRNPASFCNVVGFRPTPGRVPSWPKQFSSEPFAVSGPMARSVSDAALLLSVMAGPDPRVPISLNEDPRLFRETLPQLRQPCRIAWSPNLEQFTVAPEVLEVLERALPTFASIGATVEKGAPDLNDAAEVFTTFRAWMFRARFGADYAEHAEQMKDTVRWNIEQGLKLSVDDLTQASTKHSALIARVAAFFEHYDFLVCPAAQVLPFSLDKEWVDEINGEKLSSYLDWMGVCWAITVTGCPAVSVPAGFSDDGLPVGLQIVGPRGRDLDVLALAAAFEQASGFGAVRPEIAKV